MRSIKNRLNNIMDKLITSDREIVFIEILEDKSINVYDNDLIDHFNNLDDYLNQTKDKQRINIILNNIELCM